MDQYFLSTAANCIPLRFFFFFAFPFLSAPWDSKEKSGERTNGVFPSDYERIFIILKQIA